ncbi:MAG: hypothetical protein KJ852_04160 [Gammaproteobacteria bacterium]|nr:hypothetical protein [Gammaproteobacteria bacterium]MBU0786588.1 hypothetical protein [Gammaproteobacteria bacterium]MBU0814341.1 hypothetical protein [Gammaproteobacteria bacterium]MBU1786139.1 hypothetical protein [Gammaproteobacteria bacterium]
MSKDSKIGNLKVRVQLNFSEILHPDAISMLSKMGRKEQAEAIAALAQRGAETFGHTKPVTKATQSDDAHLPGESTSSAKRTNEKRTGSSKPAGEHAFELPAGAFDYS